MRKLLIVCLFMVLTPVTLMTSVFSLFILEKDFSKTATSVRPESLRHPRAGAQVYASLPTNQAAISGEVEAADARPELVRNYLISYNSSLEPYAETLVAVADKYNLDYRLLTAIAQQESNLCKRIPFGTFNCWGWGIHSQGTLGFSSYQEGIETVSQGLREEYLDKGYQTPEEIMSKYTPLSNGSWAAGVTTFMADIEAR